MRIALGRRWRDVALVGVAAILAAAAVLGSSGSSDDRLAWIGAAAVVAAAAAVAAALVGPLAPPRLDLLAGLLAALTAAFVVWNGLSILWSIAPDHSWDYFNRGVAYLAFLVLGMLLSANVDRAPRVAAVGFAIVVGAAAVYGLLTVMWGATPERIARLHTPIGYWNALALLLVMGLPSALWVASRREHPHWARTVGVLLVYAVGVALLMTLSRAGILVGAVAGALFVGFASARFETVAALALGGLPAVAVALWAFGRPGLTADLQSHATRVHDGRWFALVFCVVGAFVGAAAFYGSQLEESRPLSLRVRRLLGRAAWGGLVVAVVATAVWVGVAANPSTWLDEITKRPSKSVTQTPERLTTLSSTSRWQWWTEAWDAYTDRPALGTGAATFVITDHLLRDTNTFVTEPHSLPVQFLSELGPVGLLLFLGIFAVGGVAAVRAVKAAREVDRTAVLAVALAVLAYFLHGLVDFDWDFVAVTAPLFLTLGILATRYQPRRSRSRAVRWNTVWAVGAALLAVSALSSLAAPWLSRRQTSDALAAADHGSASASRTAERAHDLNPLALDPLFAWGASEAALGHSQRARRLYVKAVDQQPLNWRPWYELGNFELEDGRLRFALVYLEQATQLDPGGLLARDLRDYVKVQLGLT